MKSLQDYTMIIRPDDNGTFVAYVPAIPSCHAWGQTMDEARAEIVNVFEMIQEEYAEEERARMPIPQEIAQEIAQEIVQDSFLFLGFEG